MGASSSKQWLIIGFALGLLLAAGPGCGALSPSLPAFCNSSNCTGCCDATGTCKQTQSQSVCGFAGQACVSCGASDECFGGACTPVYHVRLPDPVADSGTAPVADAGHTMSACQLSCATCCTTAGVCRPGLSTLECGTGGAMCERCTFPQSCTSGVCTGDVPDAGGTPVTADAGTKAPSPFCGPCAFSSDCGGTKNFCLGNVSTGFCGADCSGGQACPAKTVCANIRDNAGTTIIGQNCVPGSGLTCDSLKVVDAGAGGGTGGGMGGGTGGGAGGGGTRVTGDQCDTAIGLTLLETHLVDRATATGARGDYTAALCGASQGTGPDMVFKFEVTSETPQPLQIQVGGCEVGGLVVSIDRSCPSLGTSSELLCEKNPTGGSVTIAPTVTFPAGTYYVRVDTNASVLCSFYVEVSKQP